MDLLLSRHGIFSTASWAVWQCFPERVLKVTATYLLNPCLPCQQVPLLRWWAIDFGPKNWSHRTFAWSHSRAPHRCTCWTVSLQFAYAIHCLLKICWEVGADHRQAVIFVIERLFLVVFQLCVRGLLIAVTFGQPWQLSCWVRVLVAKMVQIFVVKTCWTAIGSSYQRHFTLWRSLRQWILLLSSFYLTWLTLLF